jgi:carbohydrate-selective porin OprB
MSAMNRTSKSLCAVVCLVTVLVSALAAQPSRAQGIKRIGDYGDWRHVEDHVHRHCIRLAIVDSVTDHQ